MNTMLVQTLQYNTFLLGVKIIKRTMKTQTQVITSETEYDNSTQGTKSPIIAPEVSGIEPLPLPSSSGLSVLEQLKEKNKIELERLANLSVTLEKDNKNIDELRHQSNSKKAVPIEETTVINSDTAKVESGSIPHRDNPSLELLTNKPIADAPDRFSSDSSDSNVEDIRVVSTTPIAIPSVPVSTGDIPEVLERVAQRVQKVKIAMGVATETIDQNLRAHNIHLEHTVQATQRAQSILNRAEEFFRSFTNPGRTALYIATGIALGYTVYNICRYGQLPFAGLFRGVAAAGTSAANAMSNDVAPDISSTVNPIISPTINIHYPALPTPPSVPSIPTTEMLPWIGTSFGITLGISVVIFLIRRLPK